MKKIIALLAFSLLAAGAAFAANGSDTYNQALPTGLNGHLSTNVSVSYANSGETKPSGYLAGTYHGQGTKTYAGSSGDAQIFSKDGTAQALSGIAVPTGTASANFSGWTSL